MTKSLEALMADMKAAAEKATPGQWAYLPKNTSIEYDVGSDESQGSICYMDSGDFTQRITELNGLHVAAANPENVLKLIAALEHSQRIVDVYDMLREDYGLDKKGIGLADFVDWQDKRIAELETYSKTTIEFREAARKENVGLKSDLATAEGRIAELEALCVKPDAMREVAPLCVKLPSPLMPARHVSGELFMTPDNVEHGGYLNRDDVLRAICAAGGAVEGSD